ncbi:hypothetical protein HaLaN_16501, partial [Haematococcus lacustris]
MPMFDQKRDDKHWDDECLTLLCSFAPDSVKQLCTLGKKLGVTMLNEYCKAVGLYVPAGTLRAYLRQSGIELAGVTGWAFTEADIMAGPGLLCATAATETRLCVHSNGCMGTKTKAQRHLESRLEANTTNKLAPAECEDIKIHKRHRERQPPLSFGVVPCGTAAGEPISWELMEAGAVTALNASERVLQCFWDLARIEEVPRLAAVQRLVADVV